MADARDDVEFVINDFDGNFYLVGQQGETEEDLSYRHVYINQAAAGSFALGTATDLTVPANRLALRQVIRLNYWHLVSIVGDKEVTMEEARRMAYLRAMGISKGWGDLAGNVAAHNVQFNDVHIVTDATTFAVPNAKGGALPDDHTGDTIARGIAHPVPGYGDALDVQWRNDVKLKILNIVCIIAFFMRTRGHHWLPDMQERYTKVWRKCLYEEDGPGVPWSKLAHHVFHFMYPDILDKVWVNACNTARCAGALIKRVDSYPAGIAAVGAVESGAADVSIVFPAIKNLIPEAFEELERCVREAKAHRWAGSINRRYYGAPDVVVNEKRLGALAAVILAAYEGVAKNAPLIDSDALKRVAANAMITGSLISQMIQKAITDDRMIDPLFLEAAEEE
jgi:hypothetical protein